MSYVDETLQRVIAQNPHEPEFHQAVKEVLESLRPAIESNEVLEKLPFEPMDLNVDGMELEEIIRASLKKLMKY